MTDLAASDVTTAIVDLAASGDEVAFTRLVGEHHASMMRVAYVITGDSESARDAVQSAWSVAWRRLDSLRDRTQVAAWLIAVAANEARQVRRRERRVQVVDMSSALDQSPDGDPANEIAVVDLRRALARLKPEDRVLLTLRFVGRLDSEQIGAQLGLSASGVRSRMARLIDRLRVDLQPREAARR